MELGTLKIRLNCNIPEDFNRWIVFSTPEIVSLDMTGRGRIAVRLIGGWENQTDQRPIQASSFSGEFSIEENAGQCAVASQ